MIKAYSWAVCCVCVCVCVCVLVPVCLCTHTHAHTHKHTHKHKSIHIQTLKRHSFTNKIDSQKAAPDQCRPSHIRLHYTPQPIFRQHLTLGGPKPAAIRAEISAPAGQKILTLTGERHTNESLLDYNFKSAECFTAVSRLHSSFCMYCFSRRRPDDWMGYMYSSLPDHAGLTVHVHIHTQTHTRVWVRL